MAYHPGMEDRIPDADWGNEATLRKYECHTEENGMPEARIIASLSHEESSFNPI